MAESPITPRAQDFAAWYQDVVLQGDMAEPAEIVKGCMVIKPNGYAVWEVLQRELDQRFKATNHQNAYFPLLIPQSFLRKEAEHVEGFRRNWRWCHRRRRSSKAVRHPADVGIIIGHFSPNGFTLAGSAC
jgi:prolyl-tRNA synthetase